MSETETEVPEPTTPEPEPTEPEPQPDGGEPAAWAGPSQEEWQQTQAQLQQQNEFIQYLQTPQYPDQPQQYQELPQYDPFDPESAVAYMDARDERLLGRIEQMFAPMAERESNEQASQWAEDTFQRLGVPENDLWQEAVLFASAGFQQFDQYGRPLVHPQQAASQSYQFLQAFADMIREEERTALNKTNEDQDAALRNRADSPAIPSGPAGGEGYPEGIDELGAARMWREREAASS
jgi:hypothetical protein